MKTMTFGPGRVGPLPAYLGYLFLRFPGTLGSEETLTFDVVDTYDRRWLNRGLLVLATGAERRLVSPPSLYPLDESVDFGLYAPVTVARLVAKVRPLSFRDEMGLMAEGQLVKVGSVTTLVLRGSGEGLERLSAAILADGLELNAPRWTIKDKAPFVPAKELTLPPPDAPAAPFVVETLLDELRVTRQYEAGIRRDVDTECLHQYRVHLRRVRSLTSLGRMWQTTPEWERLKNVLRMLQQRTNELRDLDVLLLDLPALLAPLPWDEGDRLTGWTASLQTRRTQEWRRVKAWLASPEYEGLVAETGRLLDDLRRYGEPWPVSEWQFSAHRRASSDLARSLKHLGPEPADERLHEIRIRAKKLRSVLGTSGADRELIRRLKTSQDSLGRFQDHSILIERLRKERDVLRRSPGADLLAVGILIGYRSAQHQALKAAALAEARNLGRRSFLKLLNRDQGGADAARS